MSDLYEYNTEQGLIVPDVDAVQTDVENEYLSAFGSDLDLTPSTPQGRLIEMETLSRQQIVGLCALIANQINIDYATGQYLDAIGLFYDVSRFGATRTRVLATITGVANTVVPAGSIAETQAGDRFYLENETTIPSGGSISTYFLSEQAGEIPCATNTLTNIVSQIIGWETINNPIAAVIGSAQESDFEYKKRIKNSRYSGNSLIQSLQSAINQIDNVKSSFVYDNGSNSSITYDGITIPAHSILIVVDGGTDNDIAKAILTKKSSGSGYTTISGQSVTVNVSDGAYGVQYPVTFNRPEQLAFDVEIDVAQNNYTGSDLTQAVKDAISSWANGEVTGVDGLKIGQNVSPFEIGAGVSDIIPQIYVKSVKIALHGQTPSATELTCTVGQVYNISQSNITVNVVA